MHIDIFDSIHKKYVCFPRYLDPKLDLDSIVRSTAGDTLYDGSEVILAGRMTHLDIGAGGVSTFPIDLVGASATGDYRMNSIMSLPFPSPDIVSGQQKKGGILTTGGDIVERTWAYLSIRKYSEEAEVASSANDAMALKKKALDLALKVVYFEHPLDTFIEIRLTNVSHDFSMALSPIRRRWWPYKMAMMEAQSWYHYPTPLINKMSPLKIKRNCAP